ncbi:unnamed protein product [Calicophoron daubneyi]|uniref:Hint domain-containing protein n=1 Tax=Calicophoron daubneyi TaxID=300641 RepID=A0AAV2T2Y4_CALDB
MYYRTKVRSRSHVFIPGEYQPRQWENTVDASGPLDQRDFQFTLPTKRLVRVDSPHIEFDSEEARWMTKGCRDRLIKLSTQIQNTWAKQEVVLRVIRGWVKPPPGYQRSTDEESASDSSVDKDSSKDKRKDESLLYEAREKQTDRNIPHTHQVPPPASIFSVQRITPYGGIKSSQDPPTPIIDMTPEMMVDESRPNVFPKPSDSTHQSNAVRHEPGVHNYMLSFQQHQPPWSPLKSSKYPVFSAQLRRSYSSHNTPRYRPVESNVFHPPRIYPSRSIRLKRQAVSHPVSNNSNDNSTIKLSKHKIYGRSVNMLHSLNSNEQNSHVNTMNHVRFEQWLEMRMEEFHYAGRAIDMKLITRPFARTRNVNFNLGVLAQIAYYVAQFDWCYFSRTGHVHCSVKPDASITSQWFGCFPGSSIVWLANGERILMEKVRIGDRVLAIDTTTRQITVSPVVAFLHRDPGEWTPLVQVSYSFSGKNATIRITPDHLIYTLSGGSIRTTFASLLKVGEKILVTNGISQELKEAQVTGVIPWRVELNETGVFAPLTEIGSLLVDDVFTSCFAYFSNERLSYYITWPLQLLYRIKIWMNPRLPDNGSFGVHQYLQWIYNLFSPVLPETFFYSQT